jgi:protein-L-isoaspartate(D-aspartate) O-methyltransferase
MKKKWLLVVLGVCGLLWAFPLSAQQGWDFPTYRKAFVQSGRDFGSMDEKQFREVQDRKKQTVLDINYYLQRVFGHADERVVQAFYQTHREYFMYNYETRRNFGASAYEIPGQEWPIGYGSVLSDFVIQAYMTQILEPGPEDVSLEIGTGSGFQSALLSRIVKEAYTIEIITPLGEAVHKIYAPVGYDNVHTRVGDGYYGWPEVKGGFDIIIVTAAAPFVPPPLLEQLKPHGRMIIPVGEPYKEQFLYYFTKDAQGKIHSTREIKVLFIPMTGRVQEGRP